MIPKASFYLINPAGIVFGPSASLNVSGSFTVTTADEIKLADGHAFAKSSTGGVTLTSAAPAAFGFLGKHPAAVTLNGSMLRVPTNQSITVAAGPLTLTNAATLRASAGTVAVLSLDGPAMATLAPGDAPTVIASASLADVSLAGGSAINTSGVGGGRIAVAANNLTLTNSGVEADTHGTVAGKGIGLNLAEDMTSAGGYIFSRTTAAGAAGEIAIRAGSVMASDGETNFTTGIASQVLAGATGRGGNIDIHTNALTLTSGQYLTVTSYGAGGGGDLNLAASKVSILGDGTAVGNQTAIYAQAHGTGDAGAARVHANQLTLQNYGAIDGDTYGSGHGGTLSVTADQVAITGEGASGVTGIASSAAPGSTGDAGSVFVHAASVVLLSGGEINSETFGSGRGGTVSVASKALTADGNGNAGRAPTGAFADSDGSGAGGQVSVEATSLSLVASGEIRTDTYASGRGGNLAVSAGQLTIDGRGSSFFAGIFADADAGSSGAAGSITVHATSASLIAGGEIRGDAYTTGRGGDLSVTAGQLKIDGRGTRTSTGIFTDALFGSSGAAGDVTVSAKDLAIRGANRAAFTEISSEANGDGAAGTVFVHADDVSLSGGGDIDTDAFDVGRAGDVSVVAGVLKVDGRGTGGGSYISSDSVTDDITPAGSVRIHVRKLSLFNAADISSDTYFAGNGGNVSITTKSLVMEGTNDGNPTISGDALGDGDGGAVTVRSNTISILGGGEISSDTSGKGSGGDVVVESDSLALNSAGSPPNPFTGVAEFSNFDASGKAGRLIVSTTNTLQIRGGAQISTTARHSGGGDETISAGNLELRNGLITAAAAGVGGNITLSTKSLSLSPLGKISAASAGSASGDNGGDIAIGRTLLSFDPGVRPGAISANAAKGSGGNITVGSGGEVLASQGINPSDEFTATGSKSGTIKMESPEVDLTGEVAPLVPAIISNGLSLSPTCGMQAGSNQSSFTLEGGNSLPADPANAQPSAPEPTTSRRAGR